MGFLLDDDMTYCPADCNRKSCKINKIHIKHPECPQAFFGDAPPDYCPIRKARKTRVEKRNRKDLDQCQTGPKEISGSVENGKT